MNKDDSLALSYTAKALDSIATSLAIIADDVTRRQEREDARIQRERRLIEDGLRAANSRLDALTKKAQEVIPDATGTVELQHARECQRAALGDLVDHEVKYGAVEDLR